MVEDADNGIEKIKERYIVQKDRADNKPLLKQNLQSDINKIDSIILKITEKEAPASELIRLRSAAMRLLSTIDHLNPS